MGTPEFAVPVLQRLIIDGHNLLGVFTQPDKPVGRGNKVQAPPVKTLGLEHGIPIHQPEKIRNNQEVRNIFESTAPDACVVAAYGKILPQWLLDIPRFGCINVHSSLLPKYRGAAPINWAVANGEMITGVTIMQMDAGMDTGPVWSQRELAILPEENAAELTTRLAALGAELLSETLPVIEARRSSPVPQDDSLATYAPILKREDGLIDWSRSASEISNRVRGFQPWPGAYTLFRGARLIIWRAMPVEIKPTRELAEGSSVVRQPGEIVSIDKTGVTIASGNASMLQLTEVQVEGKRRVAARDFANGARLVAANRVCD